MQIGQIYVLGMREMVHKYVKGSTGYDGTVKNFLGATILRRFSAFAFTVRQVRRCWRGRFLRAFQRRAGTTLETRFAQKKA